MYEVRMIHGNDFIPPGLGSSLAGVGRIVKFPRAGGNGASECSPNKTLNGIAAADTPGRFNGIRARLTLAVRSLANQFGCEIEEKTPRQGVRQPLANCRSRQELSPFFHVRIHRVITAKQIPGIKARLLDKLHVVSPNGFSENG